MWAKQFDRVAPTHKRTTTRLCDKEEGRGGAVPWPPRKQARTISSSQHMNKQALALSTATNLQLACPHVVRASISNRLTTSSVLYSTTELTTSSRAVIWASSMAGLSSSSVARYLLTAVFLRRITTKTGVLLCNQYSTHDNG